MLRPAEAIIDERENPVKRAFENFELATQECREKLEILRAIFPKVNRLLNGRVGDFLRCFAVAPQTADFAFPQDFFPEQAEPATTETSAQEPTPLSTQTKIKAKVLLSYANGKFAQYMQTILDFLERYESYTLYRRTARSRHNVLNATIASTNQNSDLPQDATAAYQSPEIHSDLPHLPSINTSRLKGKYISKVAWPFFKEYVASSGA